MTNPRLRETRSFDEWTQRSYLVCARRVVAKNQRAALLLDSLDDAIGEALLGIARAKATHNPEKGHPLPWAIRKATHALWDAVRASDDRFRCSVPWEDVPDEALWTTDGEGPPVELLVRLTDKQRAVVMLAMDGLTCQEAAERLGLSEPRVHQLRREARDRLREAVG